MASIAPCINPARLPVLAFFPPAPRFFGVSAPLEKSQVHENRRNCAPRRPSRAQYQPPPAAHPRIVRIAARATHWRGACPAAAHATPRFRRDSIFSDGCREKTKSWQLSFNHFPTVSRFSKSFPAEWCFMARQYRYVRRGSGALPRKCRARKGVERLQDAALSAQRWGFAQGPGEETNGGVKDDRASCSACGVARGGMARGLAV